MHSREDYVSKSPLKVYQFEPGIRDRSASKLGIWFEELLFLNKTTEYIYTFEWG